MQSEDVIWNCCGQKFCAFRATFNGIKLCRNIYNVTGACERISCPLANHYYGTILEERGHCYLYLKTIERAHTPRKLWEKIKLSADETKAFEQIDLHMQNVYRQKHIEKCKARFTKIQEYLKRMRRLSSMPTKEMAYEPKKLRVREANRELKALQAAKIHASVEEELVQRLKAGQYGEIYNFPAKEFSDMINVAEADEEEEDEEIERGEEPYISDAEDSYLEDMEDLEMN